VSHRVAEEVEQQVRVQDDQVADFCPSAGCYSAEVAELGQLTPTSFEVKPKIVACRELRGGGHFP